MQNVTTLKEFRATAVEIPTAVYEQLTGVNAEEVNITSHNLLYYAGGYYIEKQLDGRFYTVFSHDDIFSNNRLRVEEWLWDYIKWEMAGLDTEDIIEELHDRARDLVDLYVAESVCGRLSLDDVEPIHMATDFWPEFTEKRDYIMSRLEIAERMMPDAVKNEKPKLRMKRDKFISWYLAQKQHVKSMVSVCETCLIEEGEGTFMMDFATMVETSVYVPATIVENSEWQMDEMINPEDIEFYV